MNSPTCKKQSINMSKRAHTLLQTCTHTQKKTHTHTQRNHESNMPEHVYPNEKKMKFSSNCILGKN